MRPASAGSLASRSLPETQISVPVLAERADPGRATPRPLAIRDRLVIERTVLDHHAPERLFAYEVTARDMRHLRGLAEAGDHIVFQRGGRASEDLVCAVRTPGGVVLSRVRFEGRTVLLLPGEGERQPPVALSGLQAQRGVIAGTQVLLIRS